MLSPVHATRREKLLCLRPRNSLHKLAGPVEKTGTVADDAPIARHGGAAPEGEGIVNLMMAACTSFSAVAAPRLVHCRSGNKVVSMTHTEFFAKDNSKSANPGLRTPDRRPTMYIMYASSDEFHTRSYSWNCQA